MVATHYFYFYDKGACKLNIFLKFKIEKIYKNALIDTQFYTPNFCEEKQTKRNLRVCRCLYRNAFLILYRMEII